MKSQPAALPRPALLAAVAAGGGALFAVGLRLEPARAWADLLAVNFYLLSMSLFAGVFLAIQRLTSSTWHAPLRRVVAALAAYLPVGALVTGLLLLGVPHLYPWARPGAAQDAYLRAHAAVLNRPFFAGRAAVYLLVWGVLMQPLLRRPEPGGASKRAAAVFLVSFAATFTLASVDWLMALVPHWASTLFPWYVFGGLFAGGFAAMAALLVLLRRAGLCREVGPSQLHDVGKCLFAFSFFWGYLWFAQYLLIWYTNIPEETAFYAAQLSGGWRFLFWANPLLNLVAPFLLLLTAAAKKSEGRLLTAGLVVLLGRWLDLYLIVMPPTAPAASLPGWLELGAVAGLGGAFLLAFGAAVRAGAGAPETASEPGSVLEF